VAAIGAVAAVIVAVGLAALIATPLGRGGHDAPVARAAGGDFNLDFIAAVPTTYSHLTSPATELVSGGLQYDSRAINTYVVESLEAKDFTCEDTVVFFTQITVDQSASGTQSVDVNYDFDAENNGQVGAGYKDVVAVGLSGSMPGQTQETGNSGLDGNETVTLASKSYDSGSIPSGFGTTAKHLYATVRVTGLDAGEHLIVRVDTRFSCFAPNPTGNLHAALKSAEVTGGGPNSTVQVGQQDIPMLGFGQVPTSTPTATNTATATATNTATATATNTATPTATNTATATATNTATATATNTATPTATSTSPPPVIRSATPTITAVPPTRTPTNTPANTPTNTPVSAVLAAEATPRPSGAVLPSAGDGTGAGRRALAPIAFGIAGAGLLALEIARRIRQRRTS